MSDERIWAVFATTVIGAQRTMFELSGEAPIGVTVKVFTPAGPPKYGWRFERLYIVSPLYHEISGSQGERWQAALDEMRLGLIPGGLEVQR